MTRILRCVTRCSKVALPALALTLLPSPAQAKPWVPISSGLAGAITVLLNSSSYCVAYTYDKNGNRLLVTSATVGSSAVTWGTGSYGCFVWTQ